MENICSACGKGFYPHEHVIVTKFEETEEKGLVINEQFHVSCYAKQKKLAKQNFR